MLFGTGNGAYPERKCAVPKVPIQLDSDVYAENISRVKRFRPGKSMHRFIVYGSTYAGGKAVVALERGTCAMFPDRLFGQTVQFECGYTRPCRCYQCLLNQENDTATGADLLDFLRGPYRDHTVSGGTRAAVSVRWEVKRRAIWSRKLTSMGPWKLSMR